MNWAGLLSVILGGGLGAGLRYSLSQLIFSWVKQENWYFLSTLGINTLGCFCLGLLIGIFSSRAETPPELVLFLGTGFCGGFTTFSTFGLESISLLEKNELGLFALYVSLSLILGLIAGFAGLSLGRNL